MYLLSDIQNTTFGQRLCNGYTKMTKWIYARPVMTLYTTTPYVWESLFIQIRCKFELMLSIFIASAFQVKDGPAVVEKSIRMTRVASHVEFLETLRDSELIIPRPTSSCFVDPVDSIDGKRGGLISREENFAIEDVPRVDRNIHHEFRVCTHTLRPVQLGCCDREVITLDYSRTRRRMNPFHLLD
jgi:hypothetical protein